MSKNKKKLIAAYDQNKNFCKCLKKCDKEDLDKFLLKWMKVQCNADLPESGPLLKVQTEKIVDKMQLFWVCMCEWMACWFNYRHGIIFGKICGEAKFANMADITTWISEK